MKRELIIGNRLTDEVLMNERSSEDRIKEIEHRLRMSRIE